LPAREANDYGGERSVERHSALTDHELFQASLVYARSTLTLQNLTEASKRHPEFGRGQPTGERVQPALEPAQAQHR
jgi:hypothetical protein